MKPANANLLNAIVLIAMGLWGYFVTKSGTAFIPVGFGVVLAALSGGIAKDNKVVAHIAVLLTLLVLVAIMGMRLPKALTKGEPMGIMRAAAMTLTGIIAMVAFIRSFIAARKAKTSDNA